MNVFKTIKDLYFIKEEQCTFFHNFLWKTKLHSKSSSVVKINKNFLKRHV